ncbi:MAG: glycosyl hydrolase family 28-related protein [Bryobacteraceae bacterium]
MHADGVADDSGALQHAINRVQETTHHGVVFIPEGRYRLGSTVYVWAGIRLVGFGVKRPVFILGRSTPGFQQGADGYMLWFTDERTPAGQPIADASEFTFYSAVTNIDFELNDGNPAAVAVRFNVAQHGFVSHADFRLGSARAAIEAVGNQASDIHVYGGEFGIVTGKTSPAWQFLLMDSSFSGQRTAAIRTHEAGFTLIRDRFADTPVAIQIPEGEVEQLYGRDLQMRHISRAAVQLGDVRNLRSQITLENVACAHIARFAEGIPAPSAFFVEEHFAMGLEIGPDGREKGVSLHHRERRLRQEPVPAQIDIPALPPMSSWVNVHTLGVKGDGGTDDTAALQRAVDTHSALFFPSGMYRLTGSLRLRPDTTLVGMNPFTTQFTLADSDPNFEGSGPAIPLLIAPRGGTNIVTGFGISTGNANPRAAGVEWLAGPHSVLEDVGFIRGRSEYVRLLAPAAPVPPPPPARPPMQLDAQYASLWIHDGGGGIFRGIWSHAGTAKAGLLVENTSTPGVIYQFSCEHHMSNEVRMDHAANWRIYDLQTEEEKPEGADAVALELESAHDLLLANTYMYRVSRNIMPKPYAVLAHNSNHVIFANVKVFSQTRLAFDNSVFDQGSGVAVRAHDFTRFELTPDLRAGPPLPLPPAFAPNARLERAATGFSNAAGLTADDAGVIYFSDAALHTIYRYNEARHVAEVLARVEGSPMVLGFVAPSTLLVVNYEKSVSRVETDTGAVSPVSEAASPSPGTVLLLPVGLHNELINLQWMLQHRGYVYRAGSNTARRSALLAEHRGYFYAPGSNVAIMAGGTWRPLLQSSQLAAFAVGDRHYVVSEDDARTWIAELGDGEMLTTRVFADRGGTSVVSDTAGNVYIAGSQIYVYNRDGRQTGVLEVPERPTSLCFGGSRHRTLFIGARGSLYAIRAAVPGK